MKKHTHTRRCYLSLRKHEFLTVRGGDGQKGLNTAANVLGRPIEPPPYSGNIRKIATNANVSPLDYQSTSPKWVETRLAWYFNHRFLNKRKVCARFVSTNKNWLKFVILIIKIFKNNRSPLKSIVTDDETRCFHCDFQTRRRSL